jgi:ubiquitin-protein ligase
MSTTNTNNTKTISSESAKRLLKDVKYIIKNPLTDNGIYYSHDETNMLRGYAMIIGPDDTPYFGGYYFFQFDYPVDYPYSPPKVTYMTNDGQTRFNPNLYKCGKVCVSILNTWSGDKWSSCQTLNSVLITLCTLLNDKPMLNEPGQTTKSKDYLPYHNCIKYKNIYYAICELMDQRKNKIPEQFIQFYPFMVQTFVNNYNKILEIVNANIENKNEEVVQLYQMRVITDYSMLLAKLEKTKQYVDSLNKKETAI